MASVTRSVGVLPYQGGTFTAGGINMGMCRLSTTRMVWISFQTNPAWMIATVVDTAGGWINNLNAPVVTNQQLLRTGTPTVQTQVARINTNAFMVWQNSAANNAGNYIVYEVDSSGICTQTDAGAFSVTSGAPGVLYAGSGVSTHKLVELQDNKLAIFAVNITNGTPANGMQSTTGSYDTVAKKFTWKMGTTDIVLNHFGNSNPTGSANPSTPGVGEIVVRPIPGRQLFAVTFRALSIPTSWHFMSGFQTTIIDNNGAKVGSYSITPGTVTTNTGAGDFIPLPGDRYAYATSPNQMQFYSIDYTTGTQVSLGSTAFTTTIPYDNTGRVYFPLTTDYVAIAQRSPFFAPGSGALGHRFKVVRRVDQNFYEQSAGSSQNSNAGFTTATATTTVCAPAYYPELIEGKIFYWGTDSTGTKLNWTVIGLNTPD